MLDHTLYASHSIDTDPAAFDPAPARGIVQFWFSLTNPCTYLMAHRLASTVRRHDVSSVWIPVCGRDGSWRATDSGCQRREIAKTAQIWNLPFHWPDHMPTHVDRLNAMALATFEHGIGIDFCLDVMTALFARNIDLNDESHVRAILRRNLPAEEVDAVLANAPSPRIQAKNARISAMAASYGLNGAPVIRTCQNVFWTLDRMEEALASAWRPAHGNKSSQEEFRC